MKVKILKKQGNCLRFLIQGIDLAIANSLRRAMIAEVPSMAIEDVIVVENSSPMTDETLALRLGLIPLKTDLKSYVLREKCDCQNELGCSKCSVTFTLEAEALDSTLTVYSRELRPNNSNTIPVSEEVPILKLARNQKISLEANARLGQGREHAKWQPVSVCTARPISKITVDSVKCNVCKKCIETCSRHILRIDDNKVEIVEDEKCNDCKQCEEACEKNAIKIEKSRDTFIFNIESTGALPPEIIFDNAIEIMKEKAQEFIEGVSDL